MSPVLPIDAAAVCGDSEMASAQISTEQRLRDLLAGMLNLPLYVLWRTTVSPDLSPALLVEHLTWMIEQEDRGVVFASGPFQAPDTQAGKGGGLTILRASDESAARSIADDDPLIKAGAVTYELRKWVLMEGDLNIRISCSRRRGVVV